MDELLKVSLETDAAFKCDEKWVCEIEDFCRRLEGSPDLPYGLFE
jgi:hypothetical protein